LKEDFGLKLKEANIVGIGLAERIRMVMGSSEGGRLIDFLGLCISVIFLKGFAFCIIATIALALGRGICFLERKKII